MKTTLKPDAYAQKFWLDSITRSKLNDGTLGRCIEEQSVTGLVFNPTAFGRAIQNSPAYDADIRKKLKEDKFGETLLFELALEDLGRAADLFLPVYARTDGMDGWVSVEVSPLLYYDTASTIAAARNLYAHAGRPNFFIEIPGTKKGLLVVEEAIFAGIPVNVTLLFSREQYLAAADAFMRGIERRIAKGLRPDIISIASFYVNQWDAVIMDRVPEPMRDQLDIAVAQDTYHACRELLSSPRWARACDAGARPQRLLWIRAGPEDPALSEAGYIDVLSLPYTVMVVSEGGLKAFACHTDFDERIRVGEGNCKTLLTEFGRAGIDINALAGRLQDQAVASLVRSWINLMDVIAYKSAVLTPAL